MTNEEDPADDNEDRSTALAMVAVSSQRLPDVAAIKKACGLQGSLASRLLSKFGKRKEEEEQWDEAVVVYWGDATLVMQPSIYQSVVKKATVDNVPMMLFTDVRVEEISDGVYRCFTTGMESLGFHEIEVDRTTMEPVVLMEFILDIAKYIVDNYLEIPEGNTFGRDAHQQFTAHYRPSMFDRGIVMKLDMSVLPLMN
jgi:Domain of unknown function (DUF4261)